MLGSHPRASRRSVRAECCSPAAGAGGNPALKCLRKTPKLETSPGTLKTAALPLPALRREDPQAGERALRLAEESSAAKQSLPVPLRPDRNRQQGGALPRSARPRGGQGGGTGRRAGGLAHSKAAQICSSGTARGVLMQNLPTPWSFPVAAITTQWSRAERRTPPRRASMLLLRAASARVAPSSSAVRKTAGLGNPLRCWQRVSNSTACSSSAGEHQHRLCAPSYSLLEQASVSRAYLKGPVPHSQTAPAPRSTPCPRAHGLPPAQQISSATGLPPHSSQTASCSQGTVLANIVHL